MATNFYFNNFEASGEQGLLADLVMESIKIYGNDVYYLPYTDRNLDTMYGEDNAREYTDSAMLEMYIKNVDGFGGDGQFLSKFNLEVRDTITFSVALRAFQDEVGQRFRLERPREGDLVWFVPSQRMMKITYVEKYPVFLQLGSVAFYDIKCEMFEYSGERFSTGVSVIDTLMGDTSPLMNIEAFLLEEGGELIAEDGYSLIRDEWDINTTTIEADNDNIELEGIDFINFTEIDPFSEGQY